jgi:branched-chain amino acid transport system substrate-binding protein
VPSARIGVSLALTGPEARYARQLLSAIELARENERSRDGLSLELVVEDDFADPRLAIDAARRLSESNVGAVIGPMNSWTCEAAGPVLDAAGLLHITPSASNPRLTMQGWRGFFRLCASDRDQAKVLAWTARHLAGCRTVAAVHDGTSFAEPLALAFLESCRAQHIHAEPAISIDVNDVRSYACAADAIGSRRADAVLIAGLEEPCRLAGQAIRRSGNRAIFLGTDALKRTRSLVTVEATDGPYLTSASTDATRDAPAFHDRFESRYGDHDSIYTVEAYDAVTVVAAAIRRAGAATKEAVVGAMRGLEPIEGAAGVIAFDEHGERRDASIDIYRWSGSHMAYVCTRTAGD